MNSISAVAFDIGNVLVRVYHSKTRAAFAEFSGLSEEVVREKLFGTLHDELERGLMSPEDFRERASELFGKDIPFAFFQKAWNDVFEENTDIVPILERLEKTTKIFLISNTDPLHFAHVQEFEVISRFFANAERRVLSFEEGARKPEEAIYRTLIAKAGVPAGEILYIDDIPAFCDAFRALGGNAVQYDARKEDIGSLKKKLSAFIA